jgi:predicted DNA-binding transcriptional regulator YafY
MKKSFALLKIYEMLLEKNSFHLSDLMQSLHCSHRTAIRYMDDMKRYFDQTKTDETILYDRKEKTYRIVALKRQ